MPRKVDLGKFCQSTMGLPMMQYKEWLENGSPMRDGCRNVMGFYLPSWQRELVWTQAQKIAFIESAWKGLNLGTFSFNRDPNYQRNRFDDLLIDGQQRMDAIECYLNDEFRVFGYYWSETTEVDKRFWEASTHFGCYITNTTDESFLREYYNLTNFGGTAHKENERA